jgi:hypothetical protein
MFVFAQLLGIYATHLQDTGATWHGLHIMYDMFIHLAFTLSLFGASQVQHCGKVLSFIGIISFVYALSFLRSVYLLQPLLCV